jgi:hypothetical protein
VATFDFESIAGSLASIFKDQLHEQFNRSAILPNLFDRPVVRTVAEDDGDFAFEALDAHDEPRISWDLNFDDPPQYRVDAKAIDAVREEIAKLLAGDGRVSSYSLGDVVVDVDGNLAFSATVTIPQMVDNLMLTLDIDDTVVRSVEEE